MGVQSESDDSAGMWDEDPIASFKPSSSSTKSSAKAAKGFPPKGPPPLPPSAQASTASVPDRAEGKSDFEEFLARHGAKVDDVDLDGLLDSDNDKEDSAAGKKK